MKRIYILMLMLLAISGGAWAQTTYYWQQGAGGSWTTAGNWNTLPGGGGSSRNTANASDILIIDQGTTQTISNVPSQTVGELRVVSGSITLTAGGGPSQTLTIGNGSGTDLIVESGAALSLASSLENLAFSNNASADISGDLIIGNTYNLSATGTVTTVAAGGTLEVTNQVTNTTTAKLIVNGTYRHARDGGNIPTATWNSGSTVDLSGISSNLPSGRNQTFATLAFTSPLTFRIEWGADIITTEDFIINFNGGTGDDFRMTNSNTDRDVFVGRNFILASGLFSLDHDNGGSTMFVAGDYIQTGGTLAETGSGTANLVFNGTSVQSFNKTGGSMTGSIAVQINSNAIVDFGTNLLENGATFVLSSGGKIITSNAAGLASTGATGSIRSTGSRSYNSGADYEFRGASTGNFSTTAGGGSNVRNLTINNNAGEVTMAKNFTVSGALAMENGYLTTGANTLLVSTTGTASTVNGAFVNGSMQKSTNSTTLFVFPVGKVAGGLRTISIVPASTAATTFTAEFIRASATSIANGNVLGAGIAKVSKCEYWTLNRSGSANATVRLSWNGSSDCTGAGYVDNVLTLRVARHNGASWVDEGAALVGGATNSVGEINSGAAVTSFSPFALATSNTADNPLPVLFDGVRAFGKNDGVQIEWSNLTERDIVRYEVERSANGIDFYGINEQAPKSNRDDKASYTHFDAAPLTGSNYYRIRVDEIGGKAIYSKILRVEIGSTKAAGFSVYPNPVTGRQFTLSLSGMRQGAYTLQVLNASGMRVHTQVINNVGNGVTEMVQLPASLQTGVYITVVSGDNYRESKQLIVK